MPDDDFSIDYSDEQDEEEGNATIDLQGDVGLTISVTFTAVDETGQEPVTYRGDLSIDFTRVHEPAEP